MASYVYDSKRKTARIHFRYLSRQYAKVERVDSERHAQRLVAIVEETLLDLKRGKLAMPPDADPKAFIVTGGKVSKPIERNAAPSTLAAEPDCSTIGRVFDTYAETLTPGSKESNTIETEAIHGRHFKRVLGVNREFDSLSIGILQKYVDRRSEEGVARATIRKELSTLRVVWGWAMKRNHVKANLIWKMSDLTFPKATEKAPFQTWDQITRRINRGGLSEKQTTELWEALWLDQKQTEECLEWVQEHARHPVIYPMFAFAAYTGARRSEIIRSELDDWDFEAGLVTIRQKKADKSKSFTRRNVPIHPQLARIIQAYLENHPGGPWVFCMTDGRPIIPQTASEFLRTTLEGGRWSVLHGWHTFRHSLASNLASSGVDQRIINEILGHSTEEMERRYRHLLPRKKEHALHSLFGTEAKS